MCACSAVQILYHATIRTPAPLLALVLLGVGPVRAEGPVSLVERLSPGAVYHVSSRSDMAGTLTPPATKEMPRPKPVRVNGDGAAEYDERVLALGTDGLVQKTIRNCQRLEIQRSVAEQPQQNVLRKEVRRLVVLRDKLTKAPFSPDGALTWSEIDLVRTDLFTPLLAGLLPTRPVNVQEKWAPATTAVQELTGMARIESSTLECTLAQVSTQGTRRLARVNFSGAVQGLSEIGPTRQQLEGYLLFDLDTSALTFLSLRGTHSLLDGDQKEIGRMEGRYALSREVKRSCPELADDALRGLAMDPTPENTRLLYDNPDLGIRFLHSRHWKVSGVRGSQITLDTPEGHGLLITVEPDSRTPTAVQFLTESRDYLLSQKARILQQEAPQQVRAAPPLDRFALDVEMAGKPAWLDYYVTRQPQGGALLAARLLPRDLATVRQEIDQLARSVVITRNLK
jgi:hypothetical protein